MYFMVEITQIICWIITPLLEGIITLYYWPHASVVGGLIHYVCTLSQTRSLFYIVVLLFIPSTCFPELYSLFKRNSINALY